MKQRTRQEKVRLVYAGIALGIAGLALTCVLISKLILDTRRSTFLNHPGYRPLIVENNRELGAPLSLPTRLDLLRQCEIEGPERLPLPEELNKKQILLKTRTLWEQLIRETAPDASEEDLTAFFSASKVSAVLRDFYNETTGARLALWCTQVWYESPDNTICLSLQLDSRVGDPLTLNAAFYTTESPLFGIQAYAQALGYTLTEEDLSHAVSAPQEDGSTLLTLSLDEALVLEKRIQPGVQFTLSVRLVEA